VGDISGNICQHTHPAWRKMGAKSAPFLVQNLSRISTRQEALSVDIAAINRLQREKVSYQLCSLNIQKE
jgi:hypothetical protein